MQWNLCFKNNFATERETEKVYLRNLFLLQNFCELWNFVEIIRNILCNIYIYLLWLHFHYPVNISNSKILTFCHWNRTFFYAELNYFESQQWFWGKVTLLLVLINFSPTTIPHQMYVRIKSKNVALSPERRWSSHSPPRCRPKGRGNMRGCCRVTEPPVFPSTETRLVSSKMCCSTNPYR